MAVNAYLVIDGMPGPSKSKTNAIDILSFSFGASLHITSKEMSSTRGGRGEVTNLTVMKMLDKTSPELFQHCVTGDFIKKVELFYDKAVGDKQEDYYKVTLDHVYVTSLQHSGSSENPTESISFAFRKIEVSYNPEGADGKLQGFVQKGFDTEKLASF
jgi:type VI secretion system secreted protein Hcp